MTCYHPLTGYRSLIKNDNGKRNIVFNTKEGNIDEQVMLPCGRCIGCRLDRSRQWAIRCVHEAELYENNCFITLTFNDDFLDPSGSLNKKDFQKFIKRLRIRVARDSLKESEFREFPNHEGNIRYFHCGEYGEENLRPHHHACIFNFDFPDKYHYFTRNGIKLYRSQILEELWPYGNSMIGDVTFDSAAYVARYIMKKINGELATEHYSTIDYETGEILSERLPEYTTMSRRPGIGKTWYEKNKIDTYKDDRIFINGTLMNPPKYYDKQFEIDFPIAFDALKKERLAKAEAKSYDNTPERLKVREYLQKRRAEKLVRSFENES